MLKEPVSTSSLKTPGRKMRTDILRSQDHSFLTCCGQNVESPLPVGDSKK